MKHMKRTRGKKSNFWSSILLLKNYLPLFATLFWCQIESRELKICFPKTFGDAYCLKKFWVASFKIISRIDLHFLKADVLRSSTWQVKTRGPNPPSVALRVKTFVNQWWVAGCTSMILCALISPYLGRPFEYLEYCDITHRKNFRDTWNEKVRQKMMKSQKFRQSQFAQKNKNLHFALFPRLISTTTLRNVMIWCALDRIGQVHCF